MSHFQQQITVKQRGWCVDTRDAGTCYVPSDVVSVPEYFATGVPIDGGEYDCPQLMAFGGLMNKEEDVLAIAEAAIQEAQSCQ